MCHIFVYQQLVPYLVKILSVQSVRVSIYLRSCLNPSLSLYSCTFPSLTSFVILAGYESESEDNNGNELVVKVSIQAMLASNAISVPVLLLFHPYTLTLHKSESGHIGSII